jgi:hypothetical protein
VMGHGRVRRAVVNRRAAQAGGRRW